MLGPMIASLHNIAFYLWLVDEARKKIIEGTFSQWKAVMVKRLGQRL
jgi:queuine tRNA-ribosyltransferase